LVLLETHAKVVSSSTPQRQHDTSEDIMTRTITANELRTGDTFKYGAHTYVVTAATIDEDGNVWIRYAGSSYEMGFFNDSPVELTARRPAVPEEPAYYAVSRRKSREIKREYRQLMAAGGNMLSWEGQAMIVFDRTDGEGKTRRVHQEYTVRRRFLSALIRMYNDPARYDIVAVEEGTWTPKGWY
jgi:hypothetical protein